MLEQLYHLMPERLKLGADLVAGSTVFSAFLGAFTSVVGAIGTAAASTYAVLRLYYYIKDRRASGK